MTEILITPATIEDFRKISERVEQGGGNMYPHAQVEYEILVAKINGKIAGYCEYEYNGQHEGMIKSIEVFPEFQKKGIGNKLRMEVENTIAKRGARYIRVVAAHDPNDETRRTKIEAYYRKQGYERGELYKGLPSMLKEHRPRR